MITGVWLRVGRLGSGRVKNWRGCLFLDSIIKVP